MEININGITYVPVTSMFDPEIGGQLSEEDYSLGLFTEGIRLSVVQEFVTVEITLDDIDWHEVDTYDASELIEETELDQYDPDELKDLVWSNYHDEFFENYFWLPENIAKKYPEL